MSYTIRQKKPPINNIRTPFIMPLHEEDTTFLSQLITAYEPGNITINKTIEHHTSLLISTDHDTITWRPQEIADLQPEDFQTIISHNTSLLIIGTGAAHHRIPHEILNPLYEARVGLEIMSTHAACRTFTLLATEGHHCTAALLIR